MNAVAKLRALCGSGELLVCPVIADPLSARLAARAGLSCALLGGFGVSAVGFALPDTGLITFTDMLEHVSNTARAVPGFPIVADGDTGYGNAMNVYHTVTEYARAGAAGILIEDQVWPKKCGHYGGDRAVISRAEARMKIRAAVDARKNGDIVVLARTDARASLGMEEAMARCRDFVDEGADIVFIEALQSVSEMRSFAASFPVTWANMMPKTPLVPFADMKAMGFRFVTYNVALPAAAAAMQDAFAALAANDMSRLPKTMPFDELTELAGLNDYLTMEEHYRLPE